jgi:hypothetical protein
VTKKRLLLTAFAVALIAFAAAASGCLHAAELIMFERAGCPWCLAFDREIAPIYPLTAEGKRAPLRRLDAGAPLPPDLAFIVKERLTPVFVLVDNGREIDRIRGYPGDNHFWGLLGAMIERLDRESAPTGPQRPLQVAN